MAKKRGTSRRKKNSSRRTGFLAGFRWPEVDWSGLRVSAIAAGWVILLGSAAYAWVAGVPMLERYASAAAPAHVDLTFVEPPVWVNDELHARLVDAGRAAVSADPLDQRSLADARDALMQTGWFESIEQVRRVRADLVVVDAAFVQPYAVVRDADGDHLIDTAGRLLPKSAPVGAASRFTVIEGVRYPRPVRPGAIWDGADVAAALRLKRLIAQRSWHEQVRGIDVSTYHRDLDLHLVTRWGHRIRWGRPPGVESAGEVGTDRKLAYLDHLDRHYGRIDGGHEGEIDITDPRGVFGR